MLITPAFWRVPGCLLKERWSVRPESKISLKISYSFNPTRARLTVGTYNIHVFAFLFLYFLYWNGTDGRNHPLAWMTRPAYYSYSISLLLMSSQRKTSAEHQESWYLPSYLWDIPVSVPERFKATATFNPYSCMLTSRKRQINLKASHFPGRWPVCSISIQANNTVTIKSLHYCPLHGDSPITDGFLTQRTSIAAESKWENDHMQI